MVFNSLTGYATAGDYRKFLVAPTTMRRGIEERIDREIAHARSAAKRRTSSSR